MSALMEFNTILVYLITGAFVSGVLFWIRALYYATMKVSNVEGPA